MAYYVYRVENAKGYGPYRAPHLDDNYSDWYGPNHGGPLTHPIPREEGLPTGGPWICGFISKAKLHEWFSKPELRRLAKLGFYPRRVRARSIRQGGKQIMFIRERRVK